MTQHPGKWLVVMLLAGSGCVPSVRQLLDQRRFADAICLASEEGEARLVADAIWQSLEPQAHVHVVTRREWESLVGEQRGGEAASRFLALRASWAQNEISIAKAELSVGVRAPRTEREGLQAIESARSYEQRRIAAAATGERIPPHRTSTVRTSWTPAPPRDPLGAILSLFAPTSSNSTITLDPTDEEYATAGPAAYALVQALTGGDDATGFVLRQEDRRGAELWVDLHLEDHLAGSRGCSLHVQKQLAIPLDDPSFEARIQALFGRRYRPVTALPGKTRAWMTNPSGFFRLELGAGGPAGETQP